MKNVALILVGCFMLYFIGKPYFSQKFQETSTPSSSYLQSQNKLKKERSQLVAHAKALHPRNDHVEEGVEPVSFLDKFENSDDFSAYYQKEILSCVKKTSNRDSCVSEVQHRYSKVKKHISIQKHKTSLQEEIRKRKAYSKNYNLPSGTFNFSCSNGSNVVSYAVDIVPGDSYLDLQAYGTNRCREESHAWNKYKGTKGLYKFSTKQF